MANPHYIIRSRCSASFFFSCRFTYYGVSLCLNIAYSLFHRNFRCAMAFEASIRLTDDVHTSINICELADARAHNFAYRGVVAFNFTLSLLATFTMWRWLCAVSTRKAANIIGWNLKVSDALKVEILRMKICRVLSWSPSLAFSIMQSRYLAQLFFMRINL